MSYHIYTTNGIILKRTIIGEANAYFHILTEDLGLIVSLAQAVRKTSSKLKFTLQEYTFASISVVKSKNGWKITNSVSKNNFFYDCDQAKRDILARICSVILKMIPGESPHPEIFHTTLSGFEFLVSEKNVHISDFECLAVLRVLYHLGYVILDHNTEDFLKNTNVWSADLLQKTSENKTKIVSLINKGLKESQL